MPKCRDCGKIVASLAGHRVATEKHGNPVLDGRNFQPKNF